MIPNDTNSETSSFFTSLSHDPDDPFRWIFHGNIVIPTANPLVEKIREPQQDPNILWLGPGLKICRNHILAVDHEGIIAHLTHESSFDLAPYHRRRSYVKMSSHEFLCPGFIDTHVHAPQFAYTGTATDRPLMGPEGWLETYTFPAEQTLKDDTTKARRVYEAVVRTTLQAGTTTALYFATLDLKPCKVLVETAINLGQRALVGKVAMDRNSPENYCQSTDQNVEETEKLISYIYKRVGKVGSRSVLPLVLPVVTPRFIPTCTPELLSRLGEVAKKHGCHIQSHASESKDEVEFTQSLEGSDKTDTEIFDSHNLLTHKTIMAHGVYLSDKDLDLMRERGSAVSHCPLSNFFFAGSTLPCRKIVQRGNKCGLGTDVAGGYSPSMLHSQRMAVVASRAHQQQQTGEEDCVLDYRHAFYMATLGGAEALGLEERIGTFAVGMEFDGIVLSASVQSPIHIFPTDTTSDVFQKLCNLGDDRNIKRVFVQGKEVMAEGTLLLEI